MRCKLPSGYFPTVGGRPTLSKALSTILAFSSWSFIVEDRLTPVVRVESKERKSGDWLSIEASLCHSETIWSRMGETSGRSSGAVEEAIPGSGAGNVFPPSPSIIGRLTSQARSRVVLGVFSLEMGRVRESGTDGGALLNTTRAGRCTKGPRGFDVLFANCPASINLPT